MKVTRVTSAALRARRKRLQDVDGTTEPSTTSTAVLRGAQTLVRLEPPDAWPFPKPKPWVPPTGPLWDDVR